MDKKEFSDKPWPNPKEWKGTWREDWRIVGQEGYLLNCHLQYRTFSRELCKEDYLQCEFCWDKFDEDPDHSKKAYYEPKGQVWVCNQCFHDFQKYFHWTVEVVDESEKKGDGSMS